MKASAFQSAVQSSAGSGGISGPSAAFGKILSRPRIEMYFKTATELLTLATFLSQKGCFAFNLTNKGKNEAAGLLSSTSLLMDRDKLGLDPLPDSACPPVHVACHYSMKFQQGRDERETLEKFQRFCVEYCRRGGKDILLISGNPKPKFFDAVSLLRTLQDLAVSATSGMTLLPGRGDVQMDGSGEREMIGEFMGILKRGDVRFGVAFNPFFPEEMERRAERERLRQKIATGLVSHVWVQLGSDVCLLREGLSFLRDVIGGEGETSSSQKRKRKAAETADVKSEEQPTVRVIGSLFVPSKQLLARMKFRPWKGVFLSDEYLSSVEAAEAVTLEVLKAFDEFGVEVLVESAVRGEKDLEALVRLLEKAWPKGRPALPVASLAASASAVASPCFSSAFASSSSKGLAPVPTGRGGEEAMGTDKGGGASEAKPKALSGEVQLAEGRGGRGSRRWVVSGRRSGEVRKEGEEGVKGARGGLGRG